MRLCNTTVAMSMYLFTALQNIKQEKILKNTEIFIFEMSFNYK